MKTNTIVIWVAIIFAIVFYVLWRQFFSIPNIPDTTLYWSPVRETRPEELLIERDENDVYHLALEGMESDDSHIQRPLKWQRIRGRRDLSVSLPGEPGGKPGAFHFWFGSLSYLTLTGTVETSWFEGNGDILEKDILAALAEKYSVKIDRWQREQIPAGILSLKLVGNFEGVKGGFLANSQVFDHPNLEPLVQGSRMNPGHSSPPQFVTINIPRNSLDNLILAVDLAWGDEVLSFAPEVGSSGKFRDGLAAQLVFLEPICEGFARKRHKFSKALVSQRLKVKCTTAGFFLTEPAMTYFIFPKMISYTGFEKVRYFINSIDTQLPDIRTVSMPFRMSAIERIELHYRHQRYRVAFPLKHLPLPTAITTETEH